MTASPRHLTWRSRSTALAAPIGFAVLAGTLAALGELPMTEAAAAATAVAVGYGATALLAPHGLRRRLAEIVLLAPAWALVMVEEPLMRRSVLPPLLGLAVAAAVVAAWPRCDPRRRPLLAAALGLALRLAAAGGLVAGWPAAGLACGVALLLPAAIGRRWPAGGALVAVAAGLAPLDRWPWLAAVLATAGAAALVWTECRDGWRWHPVGWWPGVAGVALVAAALAPWGGLPPAITAHPGWWPATMAVAAVAVTAALPPAVAGAAWFGAAVSLGPALAPPPDHGAFRLAAGAPPATLWPARGPAYGLDLALVNGAGVAAGTAVAELRTAAGTVVLRAGEAAVEAAICRPDVRPVARHGLPTVPIWRPASWDGPCPWRAAGRTVFAVADGERPVLVRDPALDPSVTLVVETGGAAAPTAPRRWPLPAWLWAAAGVVLLLQLGGGAWRGPLSAAPWVLLVAGALVARLPVEPLRLLAERHAVDLALAALLLAWAGVLPGWLRRRRVALAAAALLLPLALATPRLTPPLYGDEPFHLDVMRSLVEDHDLDLRDDLRPNPGERRYVDDGHLAHSPVLGALLAPAYAIGGRSGALLLLALAGAALTALVSRRAVALGVPWSRVAAVAAALPATYPLASFATQVWPDLPGALAVMLLLTGAGGRPLGAALTAGLAIAIKTRLALVTLPIVIARWRGGAGGPRPAAAVAMLALAVAAATAVGWLFMGHPFGLYRRLPDLLPRDPGLALRVVTGLAADAAGGLAWTAPLWLLGAMGWIALWRRGGPGERGLLAGLAATLLALLPSSEWYGGGAPPIRYLVPALPAFALGLAMVLARPRRWRAWMWSLAVPSFAAWWVLVSRPHLGLNPGDGSWWLTTALARRFHADALWLTPSMLVPRPASVVAVVTLVALVVAGRLGGRAARPAARMAVGTWLLVAAVAVAAVVLRPDRVVELESPQVRRWGGGPVPAEGTPARSSYRNGWRLFDGDRVEVPLHTTGDETVVLEGWLQGPARAGCVLWLRWDGGAETARPVRGRRSDAEVILPPPPGAGRHRLGIRLEAPRGGAAVLDRLRLERP